MGKRGSNSYLIKNMIEDRIIRKIDRDREREQVQRINKENEFCHTIFDHILTTNPVVAIKLATMAGQVNA